jgi:lysophospholipase L1-like esterase
VEPWIPAAEFRKDEEMAAYFESNLSDLKEWDPNRAEAEYQAAFQKWETERKGRRPKKAVDPKTSRQFPATLFNAMVNPVVPYAIKGAIWYQGESNAGHNTLKYEHNFRTMISSWREHWGQGDFPFYFAQLANWKNPVSAPVEYDDWASVCDQQRRTLSLKNTGMAVLNDIGEARDIHPYNKVDVGKRLALWALKNDYPSTVLRAGKKAGDLVCSGPLYKSHIIKDGKVIITFDSVGTGLMSGAKAELADTKATDEPLKHFQICGADRQWKWAQAEITGTDTIAVSHAEVANPTVVRYAWAQNPETANLYNKEGLPASIFTTEAEIPAKAGAVSSAKAQPVSSDVQALSGASLKKDDRIVFLGDSITAKGVSEDGYVTLTSQAIAKAYPDWGIEVIGAGRGGHKVPDCQKRLDHDVLQKNPTVVVIYIGINDVWHWTHPKVVARGRKGTTPEQFESGLKDMIQQANDNGARVILCTPSVIGEKPDGSNPSDKMLDEYADISRKVARETGSQLLDFRKAFVDYLKENNPKNAEQGILTEDGVHMNEEGNRLLSTLVLGALKVPKSG